MVRSLLAAMLLSALACNAPSGRRPVVVVDSEPAAPVSRRAGGPGIEYTLRFDAAHNHYVDVEMTVPTAGAETLDLMMAVWTPGSYLIREYSQHLEGLDVRAAPEPGARPDATDAGAGSPLLPVEKTRKNRWTVTTGGASMLSVRYRVYGRTATVRTNFFDDEIAVVIGAATFLTTPGLLDAPHDVVVVPREGWAKTITGLDAHADGNPHHVVAASFDELVDSPIVVGNPIQSAFSIDDVPHELATFGAGSAWDAAKSAKDVEKLTAEQIRFWGVIPYKRYVYINALLSMGGRNGLEHKDSTLMIADPWLMTKPARYRGWLGLVSHEFFHTWNAKRLRPEALGPFDYENEVHTRDLWIVEGITSYYDDLLLARAGLMTESQYIDAIGGQIASLQKTPGRLVLPLSEASYDAWIKYYRSNENSANTAVSYYTKGAVVGFLLDVQIRVETGSRRSLDDVMRLAYQRHAGERGFTSTQFRALASEVAGVDLSDFFAEFVDGTAELDYGIALEYYGLRFKPAPAIDDDDDFGTSLGVRARGDGHVMITRVERGTPAYVAGLNVGDELIAIDGERVRGSDLGTLAHFKPGAKVAVTVARRGRLRDIEVTLAAPVIDEFSLERSPARRAVQTAHLSSLLAPSGQR